MKKIGELLPPRGFELKWVRGQSLVPKILAKVGVLVPVGYNVYFYRDMCRPHCIWVYDRWNGYFLPVTTAGLFVVL